MGRRFEILESIWKQSQISQLLFRPLLWKLRFRNGTSFWNLSEYVETIADFSTA